jgi:hypothetical protein
MSKTLNISVLVAARDEYIEQLKCIICPLIIQGMNSIYEDAINISNGNKTIYKFQELLKEIPKWNQTILQEESKRIKKKCPYIMDIVTAIFVSNVKILASIRLKGKNENIRVKIPTSDIFIHSIYIEAAQQIFYDPFLFYHKTSSFGQIQKNKKHVIEIIRYSVDETIRQMLPFDNILQEYLANALDDNADNDSDSESSDDISDSDEESIHGDQVAEKSESEPEEEDPIVKNFNMDNNGFIKPQNLSNFEEVPRYEQQPIVQQFEQPMVQHFDQQPRPQQFNEQPRPQFNEQPRPQQFEQQRPQQFEQPRQERHIDHNEEEDDSDSSSSDDSEHFEQKTTEGKYSFF